MPIVSVPTMRPPAKSVTTFLMLTALGTLTANMAFASAAVLNLAPVQPANPGFGQTAQFSVTLSRDGKPIKNATIEFWFSGNHSRQTTHWKVSTNKEGRATFTRELPRDWKLYKTWVDLNASCDQEAILTYWNIKKK